MALSHFLGRIGSVRWDWIRDLLSLSKHHFTLLLMWLDMFRSFISCSLSTQLFRGQIPAQIKIGTLQVFGNNLQKLFFVFVVFVCLKILSGEISHEQAKEISVNGVYDHLPPYCGGEIKHHPVVF